jgi:hypothetical protein
LYFSESAQWDNGPNLGYSAKGTGQAAMSALRGGVVSNGINTGSGTLMEHTAAPFQGTAIVPLVSSAAGPFIGSNGFFEVFIDTSKCTISLLPNYIIEGTVQIWGVDGVPGVFTLPGFLGDRTVDNESFFPCAASEPFSGQTSGHVSCGTFGPFSGTGSYSFTWSLSAPTTCPAATVTPLASDPYSQDLFPTSMTASFTPTQNGAPITLSAAAADCEFAEFDWQQKITQWPLPVDPSRCNLLSTDPLCLAAVGSPSTILSSPPTFLDPVFSGYTYNPIETALNYPFYYSVSSLPGGCAEYNRTGNCKVPIISNQNTTLNFYDSPSWYLLPSGRYMGFQTSLVGVLSDGTVGQTLYQWNWQSTYKPSVLGGAGSGGIQTASSLPVDGNGDGGVTITGINGIAQTSPTTTCMATPNVLWPPNGKSVSVTVSGIITPGTSALTATTYAVLDGDGQTQQTGDVTLGAAGNFSFGVPLIASRNGDDVNGRAYTIRVRGADTLGNVGSCSAIVTVPHDQGN